MIAETVYPIVKALPKDEQFKLFVRLKKDMQGSKLKRKKRPLMTNEAAMNYLTNLLIK